MKKIKKMMHMITKGRQRTREEVLESCLEIIFNIFAIVAFVIWWFSTK